MAVVPGCILHLHFNDIGNPKHKFGVLLSLDPVRFFLINSRLSAFVERTAEMRRAQIEIDAASHPFLEYDSWLDCSECYDSGLTARTLNAHVEENADCAVGVLSADTRGRLIDVVEASRLLGAVDKDGILNALRPPNLRPRRR